jgi:hypothetical protein
LDEDGDLDEDSDGETSQPLAYQGGNRLRPGQEYRELLQDGKLFTFGSCVQQKKGWPWLEMCFVQANGF